MKTLLVLRRQIVLKIYMLRPIRSEVPTINKKLSIPYDHLEGLI